MRSAAEPNLPQRRFAWAVLTSVVGHGVLAAWIWSRPAAPTPPVRLEISLVSPERPAIPAAREPISPVAEPVLQESGGHSAEAAPRPAVPETPPEPPARDSIRAPGIVLNLDRPTDWDALIRETPESSPGLPFSVAQSDRLEASRAEQRRRLLLARRAAAVYGVADAVYTRYGPRGLEMKTDGRCVTLIEDAAVERGARWWAGPCGDTRRSPFTLAPLAIDGLGRAAAD